MRLATRAWFLWLAGAALVGACATGQVTTGEDDGEVTTTATGGGGQTGTSTVTGGGGSTGSSTTTTTELPCGIDCSTIQTDDCHAAECDLETKQCVVENLDGTSCDDGVFCTVDDVCQDGICAGGPPNDCGMKPQACLDAVCNEVSKSCSTVPQPNSTPCIATDLCQVSSTCQNGVCIGAPKDCFFAPVPNECHSALCNPQNGMCEPQPDPQKDGQPCTDSMDLCTVSKTCKSGKCENGTPKDCSGLTQGCNIGVCDTMTGQCTQKAVQQGQMCDDLDFCTVGETCQNGTCGAGTPVTQCSGQTVDKCCPANCNENSDKDCEKLGLVFLTSSNGTPGFYRYTVAGNTWATVASPPQVTKTQITNDGKLLYLLGTDNQVYKYDPKTDNWSSHIPGPTSQAANPIGFFAWFSGGFYYCKDGTTTMYVYRNGSWSSFGLPITCSCAGTWDEAANELYVRTYWQLGFTVVNTTNDTVARTITDATNVGENSRTGSYYNGYFYARTSNGPFQKLDKVTGVKTNTNVNPSSDHTGSDTDFFKGLVYVSGYGGNATVFQAFDPKNNTIVSLANQPPVSNHSTITVMR